MALSLFFFNDTATTEIYTLSLHDALPISLGRLRPARDVPHRHEQAVRAEHAGELRALAEQQLTGPGEAGQRVQRRVLRSEEHTSELQSRPYLVCRLLL